MVCGELMAAAGCGEYVPAFVAFSPIPDPTTIPRVERVLSRDERHRRGRQRRAAKGGGGGERRRAAAEDGCQEALAVQEGEQKSSYNHSLECGSAPFHMLSGAASHTSSCVSSFSYRLINLRADSR